MKGLIQMEKIKAFFAKFKQALQSKKILKPISEKKKLFFKEYGYLGLCALIPAFVMLLMYCARGLHPIGNGSVLVLDLNGQYVWFFEAFRNFVKGDASLLYSFARAMGGEFMGIYAYYLASPLSFILCLFPTNRMLEGLLVLFLIKTAICGGTFGYYMHKTSIQRRPISIIIFSVFYALCSYGIIQQHNTMWIDAMMWLPLITLGIEELIKHGKFKMYTLLLAITLFSNFYIGYMVCIYCFFYFFLCYIAHSGNNNPHGEKLHFLKSLLRMAFYSVLAVGMAIVILLCAYYSLNFGKSTFSTPDWTWGTNFDLLDLIYKCLPGSYDTVRPAGYPFVYCGVLTLLLLPAYFLSKKYPMRQKICSAVFVLIFVFSFTLTVTDLVWHGFQRPNWLNYRYSFMLCFYLCVLACRALTVLESYPLRTVAGTGGILALLCVILQQYNDESYVNPNDFTCIWFTLIAIMIYLAVLGIIRTNQTKKVCSIALVVVVCLEVFLNGLFNMNAFDEDVVYSGYSYYNNFLAETRAIVNKVQEKDTSFYRMEKTSFRKLNDNMALNMRGLSGSTSTLNQETIMFLQKMGYASQSHWSKYLGGTPVNDSLMGIKYVIADKNFEEYEAYYEACESEGKYTAYQNPYALSIAYGVSDDILDFKLGYLPVEEETEAEEAETEKESDTEPNAEGVGKAVSKGKAWLNKLLGIDETIRKAEYADDFSSPFERLNSMITAMLGAEEPVQVFVPVENVSLTSSGLPSPYYAEKHVCYSLDSGSKKGQLVYSFQMPEDAELYYYMPTNYPREISLTLVNDASGESEDCGKFGNGESFRIVSLGLQSSETDLTLYAKAEGNGLYYLSDQPCLYYIDKAVFEDVMARLAQDQLIVTEHTEDSFQGTFTASREKELVMTTLAFDKGWKITVDGHPVEPIKALGSVIAFYIEGDAGESHEISMVYRPNVLVVGSIISGISLGIYGVLVLAYPVICNVPVLRCLVCVPDSELTRKKKERRKKV